MTTTSPPPKKKIFFFFVTHRQPGKNPPFFLPEKDLFPKPDRQNFPTGKKMQKQKKKNLKFSHCDDNNNNDN